MIPDNPDARLTRNAAAAALTAAGFPIKPATLATKATRGGGPPFQRFGSRPLYRWADALEWAESRLTDPQHSTSQADALPSRKSTARKRRTATVASTLAE
jgi:hypothetical protein